MNQDNKNSDSNIKFQEDEWNRSSRTSYSETPKMIQWVIKYSGGLIKDEKQANYVLFGFFVLAIITSLIVFIGSGDAPVKNPYAEGQNVLLPPEAETQ